MKLAITGKGGVGKTTLTALLGQYVAQKDQKVLLVDADPAMNLAATLGVPDAANLVAISDMKELIQERMGTDPDAPGTYFRMNPRVDDIPDEYCVEHEGLRLMVMGSIPKGGGGCACAINAFLKTIISHLILYADEWVLMDMEAGVEHLGRGTASGVDEMLIVVEPSLSSLETGRKIARLAKELGLVNIGVIANQIQDQEQKDLVEQHIDFGSFVGYLPYLPQIASSSMQAGKRATLQPELLPHLEKIIDRLLVFSRSSQW